MGTFNYFELKEQLWQKSRRTDPPSCLNSECSCTNIIDSHLVQKKRFLTPLSKDGEVYELWYDNRVNGKGYFSKKYIKNALVFRAFCSKCDSEMFKMVEGETDKLLDLENSAVLIRLLARGVAREISKKVSNLSWYNELFRNPLTQDYPDVSQYRRLHESETAGLGILRKVWSDVEGEFSSPGSHYEYSVTAIPALPIIGCSCVIPHQFGSRQKPLIALVAILNIDDSTYLIEAWPKEFDLVPLLLHPRRTRLNDVSTQTIFDYFIYYMQDWVFSPGFMEWVNANVPINLCDFKYDANEYLARVNRTVQVRRHSEFVNVSTPGNGFVNFPKPPVVTFDYFGEFLNSVQNGN